MAPEPYFRVLRGVVARFLLAGAFTCAISPFAALADNWETGIYEKSAPTHIVGVDKNDSLFSLLEKKSPFKVKYSYPCVTGQLKGDKQQINDLRTPEGIYFVEYKIASGLDFREYGGIAYTLNYPNPVDRLRGKTGHGIWIHSKGFGLTPTRGCVAIDLDNIAEVGPLLAPGTPVVLAEKFRGVLGEKDRTLDNLRGKMEAWTEAWEKRSPRMFDFYDPDSYTRATENFELFRKNKERLFKILSFIKIYNREIHALEGPGYWVTWSEQLYTASNLSTEGIRRLYWQKDGQGEFRIVGMEWSPRDLGMAAAFRQGKLVAETASSVVSDASSEAPRAPRLDMPEQAAAAPAATPPEIGKEGAQSSAAMPARGALAALADNLRNFAEPLFPAPAAPSQPPDEIIWGQGQPIHEAAGARRASEEKNRDQSGSGETLQKPTPALELPASPRTHAPEEQALTDSIRRELDNLAQTWRERLQDKEPAIEKMYDQKNYNRMPSSANVPRGPSLSSALQAIRRDFRQPWISVFSRAPRVSGNVRVARTDMDMMLVTPQGMRQGVQSLWWSKNPDGQYRIVASEFRPVDLGLEAEWLDRISGPIASMLEEWRSAWENADSERYAGFYAKNASQQGRVGAANIQKQKQSLWSRVKPVSVRLTGLRIHLDGPGAKADMTQVYENSAGHADKGVKTLLLRYDGEKWRIQKEDWVPQP